MYELTKAYHAVYECDSCQNEKSVIRIIARSEVLDLCKKCARELGHELIEETD